MKTINLLISSIALLLSFTAWSTPKIGEAAPEFELKDNTGKTHKLSKYKGNYVVLEWFNHECPYVKKHYTDNEKYKAHNMQNTQEKMKKEGVIWLSINSTHSSSKEFKTIEQTNELIKSKHSKAHAVLLDPTSEVGRKYDAKTTPHMFVINPEGNIIYMGAIDDNSSSKPSTLVGAKNYVIEAITRAKAKKEVEVAEVKPYGCSVKYPN